MRFLDALRRRAGERTILAVGIAACVAAFPARADSASEAKQLFTSACGTCHTAGKGEPHRQGPNLHGIVGQKAAIRDGFAFSAPLKASDLVWDEATLDRWLENPQALVKGTSMVYRQRDPERRAKLVAYLKSLTE